MIDVLTECADEILRLLGVGSQALGTVEVWPVMQLFQPTSS